MHQDIFHRTIRNLKGLYAAALCTCLTSVQLRVAGPCLPSPRHDLRTISTFVASMSQMLWEAGAIVILMHA
jgi:hypothetical protein